MWLDLALLQVQGPLFFEYALALSYLRSQSESLMNAKAIIPGLLLKEALYFTSLISVRGRQRRPADRDRRPQHQRPEVCD